MAGSMNKLRILSCGLRVASCEFGRRKSFVTRAVAVNSKLATRNSKAPAINSKLETRNSKLPVINSQLVAAAIAAAAMLTAWPLCGGAQILNDPTRPAAGIYSTDSTDGAAIGPVLQSVMITPTARSAIIGGETVKLGGKYGDARVIRITESEVVLRSATGTDTLKMYPGVEMKPIKPPVPVPQKTVRKRSRTNK
jgi:MSHA biogenesis protein MshK